MLLELARKVNEYDDGFTIIVGANKDTYTLGVNSDAIGTVYSFESTSIDECYDRVNKYIDALRDDVKFIEFQKEIEEFDFEVV